MGTKQIAFPVASMKNMKEGRLLKFQGISDQTLLIKLPIERTKYCERARLDPFHAPLSGSIGAAVTPSC